MCFHLHLLQEVLHSSDFFHDLWFMQQLVAESPCRCISSLRFNIGHTWPDLPSVWSSWSLAHYLVGIHLLSVIIQSLLPPATASACESACGEPGLGFLPATHPFAHLPAWVQPVHSRSLLTRGNGPSTFPHSMSVFNILFLSSSLLVSLWLGGQGKKSSNSCLSFQWG